MESAFDTGEWSSASDMEPIGFDNSTEYQTLVMANKKLLLDKHSADLTIRLANGESVSAHCAVVASRCSHLLPTYKEGEHDNHHKRVIKVKGIPTAAVMNDVLEYLYTGQVEFAHHSPAATVQLYQAAGQLHLSRLAWLCEHSLRQRVSVDTMAHTLKAADAAKAESIKAICIQFALANYEACIPSKDALRVLGVDLFQEVVKAATEPWNPVPDEPAPPPDTLVQDFQRMHHESATVSDATALSPDTDVATTDTGPIHLHTSTRVVSADRRTPSTHELMMSLSPSLSTATCHEMNGDSHINDRYDTTWKCNDDRVVPC